MIDDGKNREMLKLTSHVLAHCFFIGFGLLMLWTMVYLFYGTWEYGINSKWFGLSFESFGFVMYCGMTALKLTLFFLFGIPWLAIRLTLVKHI